MVEKSGRDWNRGDEWKREGDKGRGTKWEDERQNREIGGNREEQSTNYRFTQFFHTLEILCCDLVTVILFNVHF